MESDIDPEDVNQIEPEEHWKVPNEFSGISDADVEMNTSRFKSSEEQNQGGRTTHIRMVQDPKTIANS